jgi:hypothetical protein
MGHFEAVFSDGAIVTFEADSLSVDDGLVILEREGKKKTETVVVINAAELLFIRDLDVDVEVTDIDMDWDDEDDDSDWDDDDDSDDNDGSVTGLVLPLEREKD